MLDASFGTSLVTAWAMLSSSLVPCIFLFSGFILRDARNCALLRMRVLDPHGEERQRRVSNREATNTSMIPLRSDALQNVENRNT